MTNSIQGAKIPHMSGGGVRVGIRVRVGVGVRVGVRVRVRVGVRVGVREERSKEDQRH